MTLAERLRNEPDYRPYCLACSTMTRMERTSTGFMCNPATIEEPLVVGSQVIRGRRGCGNIVHVVPA